MVINNIDDELVSSFRMKIEKAMIDGGILGLSVALIQKSGPIWMESFGYTDKSKQTKVDENTLFSLQSTTKTITALAFLLAVQKGLVKLDEPIIKYYPEFKMKSFHGDDEYKKITLKHLLSHTAGLPREARIGGCFSRKLPESFEEHIQSINNCWLQNPVGSKYKYSNIGMDLVPYILEKIVKKTYPEYVQEILGNELGIQVHLSIKKIFERKNSAKGYLGGFEAHKLDNVAYGCGGIFLSIKDQATLVQFLLNKGKYKGKSILKPEYIEMMQKIRDDSGGYGLGTTVNIKYGTTLYSHAGGGFGYGSEMYWLPEQNFGLAILDNNENGHFYSDYSIVSVVDEILKEYLEKIGVNNEFTTFKYSEDKIIEISTKKLQRLEGEYENNFFSFTIKEDKGKLYYTRGEGTIELQAHNDLIFTTTKPYGIIFELNERHLPIGCKYYHPEEGLLQCKYLGKGKQIILPTVNPNWKKFTGIYYQNYYYTEYIFSSISLDKEGYLQIYNSRLMPHERLSNVFRTSSGVVAEWENNVLFFDNMQWTKKDDVVDFYANIINNKQQHRAAMPWIFDDVIKALKQLNRIEEAEKINELKEKYYSKDKK